MLQICSYWNLKFLTLNSNLRPQFRFNPRRMFVFQTKTKWVSVPHIITKLNY